MARAGSVEQLMDRRNEWNVIGEQGRAWAIKNYSPRPSTVRVLFSRAMKKLGASDLRLQWSRELRAKQQNPRPNDELRRFRIHSGSPPRSCRP